MMNQINDPVRGWENSIKRILEDVAGIGLLALLIGCLIAPLYSRYIELRLTKNPDGSYIPLSEMANLNRRMLPIKIGLWIIFLVGWSLFIGAGLFWKY